MSGCISFPAKHYTALGMGGALAKVDIKLLELRDLIEIEANCTELWGMSVLEGLCRPRSSSARQFLHSSVGTRPFDFQRLHSS